LEGGGLLGGTALTTKYISPNTKVIAGEPAGADDASRSFQGQKADPHGRPKNHRRRLIDICWVKINFEIIMQYVDDILTVSDQEIIEAMRLIYERMKIVIEPSCAVPLAALTEAQRSV
jgi:threonine dehydratase